MDFSLSQDQMMIKKMAHDFAARELEPLAAKIDEEELYPAESIKKMAELGLLGLSLPEKYGGSGGLRG